MTTLADYCNRVPFLATRPDAAAAAVRLAGLTNVNYLIDLGDERVVLRAPGAGTSEYINRSHEHTAAMATAAVDVNAPVLFFDAADGLMVTRFIDGARTMSPDLFRADQGAVARAGHVLRKLHTASAPFAVDFTLFATIDEFKALLAAKGARLPEGYDAVEAMTQSARDALHRHPVAVVPSHCDPLCENFLDTGDRMYLIDYEYAGNNDPMWDLGDLSVEGGFDAVQDEVLLRAYFGGTAPESAVARMVVYKALCDLLWALWGVIQHVNNNPVEDFWAYAVGRFERCHALMRRDDFATYVGSIGPLSR